MATDTPIALELPPKPPQKMTTCRNDTLARLLFEEPQSPLYTRLQGCERLETGLAPMFPAHCVRVKGADGSTILIGGGGNECYIAYAPLSSSSTVYRGPFRLEISGDTVFQISLDAVVFENRVLKRCRVYGHCSRVAIADGPFTRIEAKILYPRIIYPCWLAYCRRRIRKDITVRTPWLCLDRGNGFYILLCSDSLCDFNVNAKGVVESDKGFYVTAARECSRPLLSRLIVKLMPRSRGRGLEVFGVHIPLTVVQEAEGRRVHVVLSLWNPLRLGSTALLRLHGYVFRDVKVWDSSGRWSELKPIANQVRVPVKGLSLVYVDFEATKTLF